MDNPGKRLIILSRDEIEALYGRPCFTQEERGEYFSLTPAEKGALEQLRFINAKIYFILQLGYFKARNMFFTFNLHEVRDDIRFVRNRYFPDFQDAEPDITKVTRLKQQHTILKLGNYRGWNSKEQSKLEARARQAATVCSKPIYVFRELMHYLAERRVVAPGYSILQNTVGGALAYEQRRLAATANSQVDQSSKEALKRLLADTHGLHEITLLKRDPRDFSNHEIRREVERGMQMRELYELSQKLLPHLKISNENIRYYASLVDYYSVYKLRRLSESIVYVYRIRLANTRLASWTDLVGQFRAAHAAGVSSAIRPTGKSPNPGSTEPK